MASISPEEKLELLKQASAIVQAVASNSQKWDTNDYVELLEDSYNKMIELLGDGKPAA